MKSFSLPCAPLRYCLVFLFVSFVLLNAGAVFAGSIDNEQINYGAACSGNVDAADWDTIAECSGSVWQHGVYFLGASSDTCDANHAGMMRYNSGSQIVQYCNGTGWVTFGGNGSLAAYAGVTNASTISLGFAGAFYINTSNTAYGVGGQAVGELGNGVNSNAYISSPATVSGSYSWSKIAANEYHTCGLTTAGVAYCWGDNTVGEVGDGTSTNRSIPTIVSGGYTWTDIGVIGIDAATSNTYYGLGATNFYAACGITSGNVYCWGNNTAGQLGNGTNTASSTPVLVSGGYTWTSLARTTGSYSGHICGIISTGAAYCWGANANGQLGNNSTTSSNVPVLVSGGYSWSQLATGSQYTCGITTGHAAYCWGINSQTQLGNGTGVQSLVPSAVSGGLTWSKLALGASATCGITTGGVAYCWGNNARAQVGLGPGSWSTAYSTPQAITIPSGISSTGWTDIALDYSGSMGINNGVIYSWGQPSYNNFGDPYYSDLAPVQSY